MFRILFFLVFVFFLLFAVLSPILLLLFLSQFLFVLCVLFLLSFLICSTVLLLSCSCSSAPPAALLLLPFLLFVSVWKSDADDSDDRPRVAWPFGALVGGRCRSAASVQLGKLAPLCHDRPLHVRRYFKGSRSKYNIRHVGRKVCHIGVWGAAPPARRSTRTWPISCRRGRRICRRPSTGPSTSSRRRSSRCRSARARVIACGASPVGTPSACGSRGKGHVRARAPQLEAGAVAGGTRLPGWRVAEARPILAPQCGMWP